jgi:hypothetical protein
MLVRGLWMVFLVVSSGALEGITAQTLRAIISGRVTDAATREALPNVNVFLAGTSLGAATDREGRFVITNVPLAAHELVVSMVGYKRQAIPLRIFESRVHTVDVRLQPMAIETPPVEVVAKDPTEWREQLERFTREFFGETRNAERCRIVNPEVLNFQVKGNVFQVAAPVSILVENRALGYRIEFFLEEFQIEDYTLQYRAKTRFEELTPQDEEERLRWEEQRKKAYYGSPTHFLKALAQGRTKEEGFEVSLVPSVRPLTRDDRSRVAVNPQSFVQGTEFELQKRLSFPNYLEIIYTRELAEPNFQRMFNTPTPLAERQISWIGMNRLTALFTTEGHLLDTYALKVFGYWAFERIADLLPMDYDPTKN